MVLLLLEWLTCASACRGWLRGRWGNSSGYLRSPRLPREYSLKLVARTSIRKVIKFLRVLGRSYARNLSFACLTRDCVIGGPRERFQLVRDNSSNRLSNTTSRAQQSRTPLNVLRKAFHSLLPSHWLGPPLNWAHEPVTVQPERRSRSGGCIRYLRSRRATQTRKKDIQSGSCDTRQLVPP